MKTKQSLFFIIFLSLLFSSFLFSNPDDIYWSSDFALPSSDVIETVLVDGDYVYYNEYGRLIRWNPSTKVYEVIGSTGSGSITALTMYNNEIYVGGNFENIGGTTAKFFAKWDGNKWDTVVSGLNAPVNVIFFEESGKLWIGGQFTSIQGTATSYLASSENGQWQTYDFLNGQVRSFSKFNDKVFIGGDFTFNSINGNEDETSCVAYYENSEWKQAGVLGNHPGAKVFSLVFDEKGMLYAGGIFYSFSGDTLTIENIAAYNGSDWVGVGGGLNSMVQTMTIHNGELYVGGLFSSSDACEECKCMAKYSDGKWTAVDGGMSGAEYPSVNVLFSTEDYLYAGGNFSYSGDIENWGFVRLNTNGKWENFLPVERQGIISSIACFTIDTINDMLYAGGGFVRTGKVKSYGISKFNGTKWLGCNSGLTPTSNVVYSMQAVNDTVYFTGWFNYADGIRLRNVAKWIDSKLTWEPVGNGIEGGDFDLGPMLVDGNDIYVSGNFRKVENKDDTVSVNFITRWDGEKWNDMDAGIRREDNRRPVINQITKIDSLIYVLGMFDYAGDIDSPNIAIWNPTEQKWIEHDLKVVGTINRIFKDGNFLYFVGSFNQAGDIENAHNIARFDITSRTWSKLADGTSGLVTSIVKWGDDIYIGGRFEYASSVKCNSVAKYVIEEDRFYSLGSGITSGTNLGRVSDMIVYKNDLYFGGTFTIAGGIHSSSNFAKWSKAPLSVDNKSIQGNTQIKVYPNPVTEFINIEILSEEAEEVIIEITDLSYTLRRFVYKGNLTKGINQFIHRTDYLPSGSYLLIAHISCNKQFVKFVIHK